MQFLVSRFVENEHKRTSLETLVKDHHAKNKTNDSHNYINSKKISSVPNIGPKVRKEFKKVNKDITFRSGKNLQSILCQNKNRSCYLVAILESTSWIVDAMVDKLVKQRQKY